jgi:hypothetical protein
MEFLGCFPIHKEDAISVNVLFLIFKKYCIILSHCIKRWLVQEPGALCLDNSIFMLKKINDYFITMYIITVFVTMP